MLNTYVECKAKGLLIYPAWRSVAFWPLLFSNEESPASTVTDYKIIPNYGNVFIGGSCKNDIFWSQKVHSVLVARLDGSL